MRRERTDHTLQPTARVHEATGCRDSCAGKVNTRMVNFTLDQLPYLQSAPFTMVIR